MNGSSQNISFTARGQSARQVLAANTIDDLREDASLLAKQMHALSLRIHRLARIGEVMAALFLVTLLLFFVLHPFAVLSIAGILLVIRAELQRKCDSLREEHEALASLCIKKLEGADNMQIWLDAVIRSN